MKTKDVIVYSAAGGVGLVMIFVFFFTNLFITWSEPSSPGTSEFQTSNGFSKLNSKVQKEGVQEYDEKIDLYDADLAEKKKEQSEKEEQEYEKKVFNSNPQAKKLNDLTTFLEKENGEQSLPTNQNITKETNSVTAENFVVEAPTKPTVDKKINPRKSSENKTVVRNVVAKEQASSTKEGQPHKKRHRNSDPSFGFEESVENQPTDNNPGNNSSNVASVEPNIFFQAKVHGKQTISNGSRLTVRTVDEIPTPCGAIAPNTMLTGLVTMTNQRMNITFTLCAKNGTPIKMLAYDTSDGELGIYVDNISVNQEIKRDAAEQTAGGVVNDLGIPVVGRVLQNSSTKKINSVSIPMDSGKPISLKFLVKDKI